MKQWLLSKNRAFAFGLALAIAVALFPAQAAEVRAASKPTLASKSCSMVIGGTQKIKVKCASKKAAITYKCNKNSVATVSGKGKVTGKSCGKAKVTVTVKQNKKKTKLTYSVNVKKPAISKSSACVNQGGKLALSVKNQPKKSTCVWNSSNPEVASVDSFGNVTAKCSGSTMVTANVKCGGSTCRVSSKITVPAVSSNILPKTGSNSAGKTSGSTCPGSGTLIVAPDSCSSTSASSLMDLLNNALANKNTCTTVTNNSNGAKSSNTSAKNTNTSGTPAKNTNTSGTPAKNTNTSGTPDAATAYNRMIALKSSYPEGMRWTNANSYYSKGLRLTGYGCVGFALILSDAAFGENTPATQINSPAVSQVRVGDILRVNNDTHSVIVLEVRSDGFVVAEGNYNSSIHWGRVIPRSDRINYLYTRY